MNIKQFIEFHEKENDKEVKKNWTYAEEFVWVEHYSGENKVDYLWLYNETIWREILWEVIVDENIWFIVAADMFLWEEFLKHIKKKGIKEYLEIVWEYDKIIESFNQKQKWKSQGISRK